jgi:hypothetical protein
MGGREASPIVEFRIVAHWNIGPRVTDGISAQRRSTQAIERSTIRTHDSPDDRPRQARCGLRERRYRAVLEDAVDIQVDPLVVKAEQILDLRALCDRSRITPDDVLDHLVADWS